MNSPNIVQSVPRTQRAVTGPGNFGEVIPYFQQANRLITGVTKDANGNALASCVVKLFLTATDAPVQSTTSDASGNYSFTVDPSQTYYLVAYKSGAPDVCGSSLNTLSGT